MPGKRRRIRSVVLLFSFLGIIIDRFRSQKISVFLIILILPAKLLSIKSIEIESIHD